MVKHAGRKKGLAGGKEGKMILVIGGYAQGKLDYVTSRFSVVEHQIYCGCLPEAAGRGRREEEYEKNKYEENAHEKKEYRASDCGKTVEELVVVSCFNQWIEGLCRGEDAGEDYESCMAVLRPWLRRFPNSILITEQVGNGVVPIEKRQRLLRDTIGAVQVELAKEADEVVRVICGIPQRIK